MALQKETRARYERSWFPIVRELKLGPGPYQAKLVVRDRNSGRVGSLTHEFEVPGAVGLRVSSLVLSDRLRDEAKGGGPELVARRRFAPAGTLHCQFEVYGAAKDAGTGQPRVTAGFAVRRADGRVLAAAPETALRPGPDGSLNRSLGFPLDGAPPGSYEVIVAVTDLVGGPGRRGPRADRDRGAARPLSGYGRPRSRRAAATFGCCGSRRSDSRKAAAAPARSPSSSRVRPRPLSAMGVRGPAARARSKYGTASAARPFEASAPARYRRASAFFGSRSTARRKSAIASSAWPVLILTTPSFERAAASFASSSRIRA